ncbi:MAG: redoxin domain-containing protein [Candidatus Rokuibacteriota bacterium]
MRDLTSTTRRAIQPGEVAPDFVLRTVHRDGTVSLADYRGRSALLLAFFRGIWCPFCRWQIAKLGLAQDKLRAAGVETLAVVASPVERTRAYFQYRPTRVPVAADPDLVSHRAFGVPQYPVTPKILDALETVKIDVMGELPHPLPVAEAATALEQKDHVELTAAARRKAEELTAADDLEREHRFELDTGQFLIDRDGIVRWVNFELAREGLAAMGKFPTDEELLAVARAHGV